MMDEPVSHRRLMDIPGLWVGDFESVITFVLIPSGFQILVELEDVMHEVVREGLDVLFLSFSFDEFSPSSEQIFRRDDILKRMKNHEGLLPVIEHMLSVYKTWYGYRDNIPKKSRYTLGDKIDVRFIQVLELLHLATYQTPQEKIGTLERALIGIDAMKFLLKITWEVRILDSDKYLLLSKGIEEGGRQVGGWRKGLQTKTSKV